MCSLQEHIERDIRAREAERQAEQATAEPIEPLGRV